MGCGGSLIKNVHRENTGCILAHSVIYTAPVLALRMTPSLFRLGKDFCCHQPRHPQGTYVFAKLGQPLVCTIFKHKTIGHQACSKCVVMLVARESGMSCLSGRSAGEDYILVQRHRTVHLWIRTARNTIGIHVKARHTFPRISMLLREFVY